jgi:circadian clock protein KaiC
LASSGIPALDELLSEGYPDKSVILLVGPPGAGKEALIYKFIGSGLSQGDFCFYITKKTVQDVEKDAKAFGFERGLKASCWMAVSGGDLKFDIDNLARISHEIKGILGTNAGRKMRVVIDAVSSILMLNPADTVYRFLTQLSNEVKQYDAVLLVTLEEGMHPPEVFTAMQELFDGVIELRLYEEGMKILPILRIRKMIGQAPRPQYYNFAYSREFGLEISVHG